MAMKNTDLPIYEIEPALRAATRSFRRFIVQAPAGSGKSTQVPQMLLDRGLVGPGRIIVLQPRRLAARLLAGRVADERGVLLGGEVGYQIRFEDRSCAETRIHFITEGILLRRMLSNPVLDGVAAVLFDEFHERHAYGDISLAMALRLQETLRPDLLIGVMSATIESGPIARYLEPCAVLNSSGRMHAVEIIYVDVLPDARRTPPIWDQAADACERMLLAGEAGDGLVFMPGAYEIERTIQALRSRGGIRNCAILPLHGELSPKSQDAAVTRCDRQKIIVATNVAETSITIDGITFVVDSGLARVARFDPYRGIDTLLIERISRASADQRAGRAGRTAPGQCLRLWTERDQAGHIPVDLPEIRRVDLSEMLLLLRAGGVGDVAGLRWLDLPEPRALERSERLLRDLGALEQATGEITDLGRRMLAFPLHPRYSCMLLAAGELGCVREAALIAALTQDRSILFRRADGQTKDDRELRLGEPAESDFMLLTRAWEYAREHDYDIEACRRLGINASSARQVGQLHERFLRLACAQGLALESEPAPADAIGRCVLAGFSDRLAKRIDGGTLRCRLVHGRVGELARESVVRRSPLFVAAEVREVERGAGRDLSVILSLATAIREEWLQSRYPADFSVEREVVFDAETRRVVALEHRLFRDLLLESRRTEQVTDDEAAMVLAGEVFKGRLSFRNWDEAVEQWIIRLNCLATWCPDLGLPALGDEGRRLLVEQACYGCRGARDLKEFDVWPVVRGWLNPAQVGLLDRMTPERLTLPKGRRVRVVYAEGLPPVLSATIQDLYGLERGLGVAGGRVPVLIHVLAPNRREVQVTQDLAGFWRDSYPAIKRELQRKYPRHEWR